MTVTIVEPDPVRVSNFTQPESPIEVPLDVTIETNSTE